MKKIFVQVTFNLDVEVKNLVTNITIEADEKEILKYTENTPVKKEGGPSFDDYIQNYKEIIESTLSKLDTGSILGE